MSQASSNLPRVLFVDDDIFFATGYLNKLDELFRVTVARDVAAAEAEFECSPEYACVVLDVMMPVATQWPEQDIIDAKGGALTGLVTLRRCKDLVIDANLPVVVLTNRQPEEVRIEVDKLDIPNHLVKVFHKSATPAFRLPEIVCALIQEVKDTTT